MSSIRYYTDEHVAKSIAATLRVRGIDALTTQEAGMLTATDLAHLDLAKAEGRVIFTQDDDFLKLAAAGYRHAGIVYAPQGTPIGDIVRGLVLIHHVLSAEDMIGNIEFL